MWLSSTDTSQHVDYLIVQAEEVRIVLSHLCLSFRDDLTYVPVCRRINCQTLINFLLMELTRSIQNCSLETVNLKFFPGQ